MGKKLVMLLLLGTLTLTVGCTGEKNKGEAGIDSGGQVNIEEEDMGLWVGMANEEVEAIEDKLKERDENLGWNLEPVDLYPYGGGEGNLFGYMNSKGETIIEPQFQWIEEFSYVNEVNTGEDHSGAMLARVINEEGKMNFIDANGEFLIDGFNNQYIGDPKEGLIAFANGSTTCGVMDFSGKVIFPEEYEDVKINEDGYISLMKNGKWGLFHRDGNRILDHNYDYIYGMDSVFQVSENGKYGAYDRAGKEVIPSIYDDIRALSKGLYVASDEGGKYIIYNGSGEILSQGVYSEVLPLNKELYGLKDHSEKYALYNGKGEKISDHIYDMVMSSGETMVKVLQGEEYKYINEKGEALLDRAIVDIPYEGLTISTIDPRFAEIKVDGKCGLIDMYGEYILEPKYDSIYMDYSQEDGTLIDDCFITEEGGKRNLINKEGEILREDFYEQALITEDFIIASDEEYMHIILDFNGNEIGKGKYKHILSYEEYLIVTDNIEDKYGYIVDVATGEVMSEELYERVYTKLDSGLVIGVKDDTIYMMNGDCEVTSEFSTYRYGFSAGNIEIHDENLIRLEHFDGAIHWINRKGQLIK